MHRRLKTLLARMLWAVLFLGSASTAFAQSDDCALPRAVIAGETALRNALSRADGNAAPLLSALERLSQQTDGSPEINAYVASRQALAIAIADGQRLSAQRLIRTPPHDTAGQAALTVLRADDACSITPPESTAAQATAARDGGQVAGGHGGVASSGAAAATGDGRASQPSGDGLATSPLSFLRGFDLTLHILPSIGATLAFGALVFALTRDRRQYRRYLCHMPISVVGPDGPATATVLDLSQGGAKITRNSDWEIGTRLRLGLNGTERGRAARIMWANKGFAGVIFRKPLTRSEFHTLLTRAKSGAGAAERDRR